MYAFMPHVVGVLVFWVCDMLARAQQSLDTFELRLAKVFKQSDGNEKEMHFSFIFWDMIIV